MKVFLSSTAEDLTEYRKVADETILRLKMDSVLMERFGPLPGMPIEECERLARDSDLIVCIVAHRYGSVPEPGRGSFTEREVRAAHNVGKDIRVWIVQDDFLWKAKKEQDFLVDPSVSGDKKRAEEVIEAINSLISFKTWLRETFVCESFTTPDDLAWKISLALKNSTNVDDTRDIRSDAELRLAYESTAKSRHPCKGAKLQDLDWSLVDQFREKELLTVAPETGQNEVLEELGLFSPLTTTPVLHKAAVLCFCKRPHKLIQQAYSTFMVGQPGDNTFILKDVTGPLSAQVDQLVRLTMERLSLVTSFESGGLRNENTEIPLSVVREAISNAVAHRDYELTGAIQVRLTESYLEVQNPGSFPPDASWETFLTDEMVSRPIDMAVAYYLKSLLAVEGIGRGFAVFRNHLATFGDDSIEWTTPASSTVLVRIKRFAPQLSQKTRTSEVALEPLRREQISIANLPSTGANVFGREAELNLLDAAWENPNINVFTVVGWGGLGKTALVNHWLKQRMARDNYRGAQRVYGWSFYSQGSNERVASADLFMDKALRWFGDSNFTQGSPWEKGERLAALIRQSRTLLILDGLEPLQHPPGPHEGRIKDAALQALLGELAAQQSGLCVVTTRERITDLLEFEESTVQQHNLASLSPHAGAQILRSLRVTGEDQELEEAAKELEGHPFSLTLLGSYLTETFDGDIRRRREVGNLFEDSRYGDAAQRLIEANEKWLGEGIEVGILRLLGLFDRPADIASIAALRQPPIIPDLTEPLQNFRGREWNRAVAKLRRINLLAEAPADDPGVLDTHPLVREYFKQQLKRDRPHAWREANRRLYEHFKSAAKEFPETIEEMSLLYAGVTHGSAAGRYQETFDEVYVKRIQRGNEYFSTRTLGAYTADLSALSGFFEIPWVKPFSDFDSRHKSLILSTAGVYLRALGRLQEAAEPLQTALKIAIEAEAWERASVIAGGLSQLNITIGALEQGLAVAQQSVRFAEHSINEFIRVSSLVKLAHAMHQLGHHEEAAISLNRAEEFQRIFEPEYPFLFSSDGFQYCELLLAKGQIEEVQQRVAQTLEVAKRNNWLLDIGLDHLTLGRAWLEKVKGGESDSTDAAREFLQQAVEYLRRAGNLEFLVHGLLARAEIYRFNDDYERASRDLAEVLRIATRSDMRLHLANYHLESARLGLVQEDKEKAFEHLTTAKEMVDRMGYHRRDKEVVELEAQLA